MKKLSEIIPELLEYTFNYDQSNDYSKKAFDKYSDMVVCIRKTPRYYFVLLKGSNKFFGYKLSSSTKKVLRLFDLKGIAKKGGRVSDRKEFILFKKGLILEELK